MKYRHEIFAPNNCNHDAQTLRSLIYACFIFASTLMASESENLIKEEYARFEGTWSFAHVEVDGKKQPEQPFETNKTIISERGRYVVVQGARVTPGVFKIDPTKSPKQYDFTITGGPAKGRTGPCIYELEGDTFKFASSFTSNERPADFVSKPGSGIVFEILKREKQSVAEALTDLARTEMAGAWQAVSQSADGKESSRDDLKTMTLSISAEGKVIGVRGDRIFLAANTKLDPSKNPMTIDLTYTERENAGQTALGICKIEDALLTICHGKPGQPRPADFVSKPDTGDTLTTYRRPAATP
jgi:uncharacterized protein (TIGR03067 family)